MTTELPGTWFSGQDSTQRAIRLAPLAGALLRVEPEDPGAFEGFTVPLAQVRLSPRLGRTPRVLVLPEAGRIEAQDDPAFDTWFATPSRIEAAVDWLERRKAIALGAALFVALGTVAFVRWGLPATARIAAPYVPAAVERAASQQAMTLMDRMGLKPTRLPAARQAELRAGFARLVAGLPRQGDMRLDFRRSPALGPNAFALPDGRVVMTDELIELAGNDEELYAVLAHEAGHHEHRHAMRGAIETSGVLAAAAVLFGDASGTSLTVSLPVVLLESGFSRSHEREADAFALALLARRGGRPAALGDALERLERDARRKLGRHAGALDVGYLSTHPPSAERIDGARAFRAPARAPAAP
jgi:Zn-dependent protease with chaperone function